MGGVPNFSSTVYYSDHPSFRAYLCWNCTVNEMKKIIATRIGEPEKVVEAYSHGKEWAIQHPDGRITYITDHKFRKRYDFDGKAGDTDIPKRNSKSKVS